MHKRVLLFLLGWSSAVLAQSPFPQTGQIFAVGQNAAPLGQFMVAPGYNSVQIESIGTLPPGGLEAIGVRKTDQFIYGISPSNNHLYRVGQGGIAQDLGAVGLDNTRFYLAGDVSPDGAYLFSVGSNSMGADEQLAKTDLNTLSTTSVALPGATRFTDIAFHPFSGDLFGFDLVGRRLFRINPALGTTNALPPIAEENNIFGLYFDALGDLYGYGTTVYGVVDAQFLLNTSNGAETLLATGPNSFMTELAACPFSVELKNRLSADILLPCSDLISHYTFANATGETLGGLEFLHPLPTGFYLAEVLANPFGASIDTLSIPGTLRIQNLSLQPGLRTLSLKIKTGDLPAGKYRSQARLTGLPAEYGGQCLSDNTRQPGFEDTTGVTINRFEEDSLSFQWFICHGETLVLDGAQYGNTVQWSTGVVSPSLPVTQGGVYSMKSGNTCEFIYVSHEVSSGSCPYTIAVRHLAEPDSTFACSDLVMDFVLINDSGEPRYKLHFTDTLPAGFSFVKILDNPFGGELDTVAASSQVISLRNLDLPVGRDTLRILAHVGDLPPATYRNRAFLHDLPTVMGPFRMSDNPLTFEFDSTAIQVLGAISDSAAVEKMICAGSPLTLDASGMGLNFLWDNGETEAQRIVILPGEYRLTIFDGCEPADIIWQVQEGAAVKLAPLGPFNIHQGEWIALQPAVSNAGQTLAWHWTDPSGSLSCQNCPNPIAAPLQDVVYGLKVTNEHCSDSIGVALLVDVSRRVFAPNVFLPGDSGFNGHFYLQSPDAGIVRSLEISDRWGNLLFRARDLIFNDEKAGWDGGTASPGIYIWQAVFEFPDGKKERRTGEVLLLR